MGNSINRTSFVVNGRLTIKDGNEKENYVLMSDSKGIAGWSDPSADISDKPNAHYIGEMFGGGIVVSVWMEKGVERCLVASTENISNTTETDGYTSINYGFQWSSATSSLANARSRSFGASNSEIAAAQSATSSAKRCLDYLNPDSGTGIWDDWHLPSIYELNMLANNAAIFNKVLDSYSTDSGKAKMDTVYMEYVPSWPDSYYITNSLSLTDINLFSFGGTKYNNSVYNGIYDMYFDSVIESNDVHYYWSSTEDGSTSAWSVMSGTLSSIQWSSLPLGAVVMPKNSLAKVRPFRIADDTQTSFQFDADYAVISYKFSGEKDLDTRTTMISPSAPSSESGWGTPYVGAGWTPDYPAHPNSSTYSVLWHGGDNLGYGYETVLININAFKYHYPGQSEIVIDARAHWYVDSWEPTFEVGDQARLDSTDPVILGVDLYKGGSPVLSGYQWTNPTAGSSMSLDSYGMVINAFYIDDAGAGQRVSKFKYNVVGKFGYLMQ